MIYQNELQIAGEDVFSLRPWRDQIMADFMETLKEPNDNQTLLLAKKSKDLVLCLLNCYILRE